MERLLNRLENANLASLSTFIRLLPYTPISVRKALLTCTRCQEFPVMGTRLYDRTWHTLNNILFEVPSAPESSHIRARVRVNGLWVGKHVEEYFASPLLAGLLSLLLREMHYEDYTDVEAVRMETYIKECNAAMAPETNVNLNYSAWFAPLCSSYRLAYNVAPTPVQIEIRDRFMLAKAALTAQVFYPAMSEKSVGKIASSSLDAISRAAGWHERPSNEDWSLKHVQRLYCDTGIKGEGPTEMRSAWKYNDLKPRIYYAQGPTVYWSSLYIQQVMNTLVDSFPCTHRIMRFSIPALPELTEDDILFIYDYSSFTSSLTELSRFIDALAEFYDDVDITVIDTHLGPTILNLGEYLREYNRVCCTSPEFDITALDPMESLLVFHNTGMLGVPGNITSSTLLHGLHLSCLLESLLRGKCVGDDAIGIYSDRVLHRSDVDSAIANLGEAAVDKMESWDANDDPTTSGWHFVKRPLVRLESRVLWEWQAIWPSLANILNFSDAYHVPAIDSSEYARSIKFLSQYRRMLTTIDINYPHHTEEEGNIVFAFAKFAYDHFRISYKGQVAAPVRPGRDSIHMPFPPLYHIGASAGVSWRDLLKERMTTDVYHIPVVVFNPSAYAIHPLDREPQRIVIGKMEALLMKLGFIESDGLAVTHRRLDRIEDEWLVDLLLSENYTTAYDVRIVYDLPQWTVGMLLSVDTE